jgi:EAL domain-containing protein (putative c-di-GMP-specific phosphodiesterase class I)
MSAPARGPDFFRLRAEWLRFKNHVFDAELDLPTLSAALDDARRLLEERGALGLVYLDPGSDGQTEGLHGWQAYDEVVGGFADTLKALRQEGFLGTRDLIATLGVRSDKFIVFVAGPKGVGLDAATLEGLVARLRERLALELPRRVTDALAIPLLVQCGHALLHRDPMLRPERAVHRALDEAMLMAHRRRARDEDQRTLALHALIESQQVVTLYQPILNLSDLSVLGHEVFTRGTAGSPFEDPEQLFALALRAGRVVDFERLCRSRALESARRHLARGAKLFLNTAAHTLGDNEVAGPGFVKRVDAQGLEHKDVVLEIAERVTFDHRQRSREVLSELKQQGFGVAIDDMGAGYSSLSAIVELEPDYLKFDIALVRNIHRSVIKRSLLETLVELSQKIGAPVIAEGIEDESELQTLRELGVGLGQGRFLSPLLAVPQLEAGSLASGNGAAR